MSEVFLRKLIALVSNFCFKSSNRFSAGNAYAIVFNIETNANCSCLYRHASSLTMIKSFSV